MGKPESDGWRRGALAVAVMVVALLVLALSGCAGWAGAPAFSGVAEAEVLPAQAIPDMAEAEVLPAPAPADYTGGLTSANVGGLLDADAWLEAESAGAYALDAGIDVLWEAANTEGYGGPARGRFEVSVMHAEAPCRAYSHTVLVGGRGVVMEGIACRGVAGSWFEAWPVGGADGARPGPWPGCYRADTGGWSESGLWEVG